MTECVPLSRLALNAHAVIMHKNVGSFSDLNRILLKSVILETVMDTVA